MASNPVIRQPILADARELFELIEAQGSDLNAFAWRSGIKTQRDEEAFILWAQRAQELQEAFNRIVEYRGRIAGCVSLYRPHQQSFPGLAVDWQIGYWIGRSFRGEGLASEAARMLMAEAAAILPHGASAGVRVREGNLASIRCARRIGLRLAASGIPSQFASGEADAIYAGPLGQGFEKAAHSSPNSNQPTSNRGTPSIHGAIE